MKPELYFDISSEESGGSLYRQPDQSFLWHHSTYNDDEDETKVFKTTYPSFEAFWKALTTDRQWYYQHPMFVHPEVRPFVGEQLKKADWSVQGDAKWQISHQKQWTKVLSDRPGYYNPI
jgi:hypothetical protein